MYSMYIIMYMYVYIATQRKQDLEWRVHSVCVHAVSYVICQFSSLTTKSVARVLHSYFQGSDCWW